MIFINDYNNSLYIVYKKKNTLTKRLFFGLHNQKKRILILLIFKQESNNLGKSNTNS